MIKTKDDIEPLLNSCQHATSPSPPPPFRTLAPPKSVILCMEPSIQVECCNCHRLFFRLAKEVRRNAKLGRPIYCNLSCCRTFKNESKTDEFSAFRYILNRAKTRVRNGKGAAPQISVEYLKYIWEKQGGICPYTNIPMVLPVRWKSTHDKIPNAASLDRIDSSKEYIEGNLEFVCMSINFAKNGWKKDIFKSFLSNIQIIEDLSQIEYSI